MRSTEIVRAMDTGDEQEISVSVAHSIITGQTGVMLCDSTQIPYHRIRLTAAEARKLAAFLTEQADEADVLNA